MQDCLNKHFRNLYFIEKKTIKHSDWLIFYALCVMQQSVLRSIILARSL